MSTLLVKFSQFLGRFTYRQRFVFWTVIFAVSIIYPAYWVVKIESFIIHRTDQKIEGIAVQRSLGSILSNAVKSQLEFLYAQQHPQSHKRELDVSHESIKEDLDSLVQKHLNSEPTELTIFHEITYHHPLTDFSKLEQKILQQLNENDSNQISDKLLNYQKVTRELQNAMIDAGYAFNLVLNVAPELAQYPALILHNLPEELVRIGEITFLILLASHSSDSKEDLTIRFQNSIDHLKQWLHKDGHEDILSRSQPYSDYHRAVSDFIENSTAAFSELMQNPSSDLSMEFLLDVINVINLNERIRSQLLEDYKSIMKDRRSYFFWQRTLMLIIFILGFVLSWFLVGVRFLTRQFVELLSYIRGISKGDFSHVLNVNEEDDVGQIGIAFNQMRDSISTIIQQIQELGKQLKDLTKKIAHNAYEREQTVKRQEDVINHIALNTKLLVQKAQELSDSVQAFTEASGQFFISEEGKQGLSQLQSRMGILEGASAKILNTLTIVSDRVANTWRLTKFMTKVSDQAKLLSLNAAIETLNIGPQHQIFSDITEKIQRFAVTTANSTFEIQQIINAMSKSVSLGSSKADACLRDINEGATRLISATHQLSNITLKGKEQIEKFHTVKQNVVTLSIIAEQILLALKELHKTVQNNFISMHAMHETLEIITQKADEHNEVLKQFFVINK